MSDEEQKAMAEFKEKASADGAVKINQEYVSRDVAIALVDRLDALDALTEEQIVEALTDAIPRARQIARDRAAGA